MASQPRFPLARAQRIRKRPDFVRIQASSARVSTRHLLLLLALAPPGAPRLGVVASRKVGKAVVRNRAKRLVREAFRLHSGAFPQGLDIVIIVRPGTHLASAGDLGEELARRAAELTAR